jgi:hypothetical protein
MLSSRHLVISAFSLAMIWGLQAADRAELTFADGNVYVRSVERRMGNECWLGCSSRWSSYHRATSKQTQATTWIKPKSNGLTTVLGVLAARKGRRALGL